MKSFENRSLQKIKRAATLASLLSPSQKDAVLSELVTILQTRKVQILQANKKDVNTAKKKGLEKSFVNRLTLSEKVFKHMIHQLKDIIAMPDPTQETIEQRRLKNDVLLKKIRVPLGVIFVIYEARPEVTLDVAGLCIKSGNAVILKSGSEAYSTSSIIYRCIVEALKKKKISEYIVSFVEVKGREMTHDLLSKNEYIDLVIARGGYEMVKNIMTHSKIPVLAHAAGGARIYIDQSADLSLAVNVCLNAKINRPATCNSLDTLVVHEKIAQSFLPLMASELNRHHVEILGDEKTRKLILAKVAAPADYDKEFLDLILTIKIVSNVDEAIEFITKHSKNHSEGIISQDPKINEKFIQSIDAASVFVNCSTRLHDGGEYEMGAEMGVATGKLHARGPVGLRELTTYRWIAYGNGQLRD